MTFVGVNVRFLLLFVRRMSTCVTHAMHSVLLVHWKVPMLSELENSIL